MIKIYDKETGSTLGTITEDQLQFLIDQLEEEDTEDRDYYLTKDTLDMLEQKGIGTELLQFLRKAMGNRESMEILWEEE
jgi:processive 1,2-diacylglycerol beta-glucosyltransferase